jgi:CRISPR-associated protein Cas2
MSRSNLLSFGGDTLFVVIVYDVHQKRCHKVMKLLRQYMEHRQRSVFTGFLTKGQVGAIQHALLKIINVSYDNVIIFQTNRADQIEEWTTRASDLARITSVIIDPPKPVGFTIRPKVPGSAGIEDRTGKGRIRLRFKPLK